MSDKSRYEVLDGLRGIAAFVVMVRHYTQNNSLLLFSNSKIFTSTPLAVDLFFMLSGFVIAHSYSHRLSHGMTVSEYLVKRFIRLFPMFFMGIVLGAFALSMLTQAGQSTFPVDVIVQSFALNSVFLPFLTDYGVFDIGAGTLMNPGIFPGNPPAWSLFYEMIASLAFVLLFRLDLKKLGLIAGAALMGFMLFSFMNIHTGFGFNIGWGKDNFIGGFPRVLFGFTTGLILYRLHRSERWKDWIAGLNIKSPYVLYVLLIVVLAFPNNVKGVYPLFILMVVAPAMVFLGAQITCKDGAASRVSEFLGWLSYPVYCLHFPVGRAVWLLDKKLELSQSALAYIASGATITCAILLTKFLEEPARKALSAAYFDSFRGRE